ncbi:MAG: recombinase family protein [Acutalibacteraceae bacterium]
MKKIAACYIRVSTDDQIELSPESQLIEIRKYADAHGYYIPDEYVFKDEGISGRTAKKRPEFNRMISVAKSKPKPFDALLLWKFSRFARNRTDAVVYKNLLRNQCGIDVISISENIGEDKGTSVILEAMFEAIDEYYSINLSTEVKRSMQLKAERGEPLCKAPFGYKNENKAYVIDENQAQIVRMMFDLYESGAGLKTIAVRLGDMGVRTLRGNLPDNRWVEYVLTNPVYTGKIRWTADGKQSNKKRYKDCDFNVLQGKHEPIISDEQFNHVAELLSEQKKKYTKYQREESGNGWMLRGLVRCSSCGATLIRSGLSGKYPFLQCHKYNRGQCKASHYITEQKINRLVISQLEQAAVSLNFELTPSSKSESRKKGDAALKKMIEAEKRKLIKVREAYEAGVDTLAEYKENKKRIQDGIASLESELNAATETFDKKKFAEKLTGVLEVVKNPTVEPKVKNSALRTVVNRVIYDKAKDEIRILFYA